MVTPDTTLYIDRFEDEYRPNPDGQTVTNYRMIRFRLGKFGPFTERFLRDTFTDAEFRQRVDAIRQSLVGAHQ